MAKKNPFVPNKTSWAEVGIRGLGVFFAGIIGSLFIMLSLFFSSKILGFSDAITNLQLGSEHAIFPIIISLLSFFGIFITILLTFVLLGKFAEQSNSGVFGQISVFLVISYICCLPIFIYAGYKSYETLTFVLLLQGIIVIFGSYIIYEIITNYRYSLVGIFGLFIGIYISAIVGISIFFGISGSSAKLFASIFLLPLSSLILQTSRNLFEFLYLKYYKITGSDSVGQLFYAKISEEMKEVEDYRDKQII